MANPQTILLNGKEYDALTGKLINDPDKHPSKTIYVDTAKQPKGKSVKVIDGFIRQQKSKVLARPLIKKTDEKPKTKSPHRVAPHAKRITQHSKTLMRNVVKKPEARKIQPTPKVRVHPHYKVRLANFSTTGAASAKQSIVSKAESIKKSNLVTKFGELTTPAKEIKPNPDQLQTTVNSEVHLKKLDVLTKAESNTKGDQDVFAEAALRVADSHQQITRKKTRFYEKIAKKLNISNRLFIIISVVLAVIILTGAVTYFFSNNIEMYIADERTGMSGVIPGYAPSGFNLKKITYTAAGSNSVIILKYHSNSDSRLYDLSEQVSNWDSQSLLNEIVIPAAGTSNYTTLEVGGRTVYMYGEYAVWVSGGIYYNLHNKAGLTSDQIQLIANST